MSKKVSYPHFRYYRKSGHPALILGEVNNKKDFLFRKVSHEKTVSRSKNVEKVFPNPDITDKSPMYIEKRKRVDRKYYFRNSILPWKYKK